MGEAVCPPSQEKLAFTLLSTPLAHVCALLFLEPTSQNGPLVDAALCPETSSSDRMCLINTTCSNMHVTLELSLTEEQNYLCEKFYNVIWDTVFKTTGVTQLPYAQNIL